MSAVQIDRSQVRRNFSQSSGDYDRHARVQQQVVERLVGLAQAHGALCSPILDVGTGTGRLAQEVLSLHPEAEMVLSDLAHGMTRHASSQLPAANAFDADAAALPVRGETMGAVISSSVYQWLGDLEPAFREGLRVLRGGGFFVFALFGQRTLFELRRSHRRAAQEQGRSSHVQRFPDASQVRIALDAAGFSLRQLLVEEIVEEHPNVAALLRSLKKIGARNAAADRPGGLSSRRLMARMESCYLQEFGAMGTVPATYEVIYVVAQKVAAAR